MPKAERWRTLALLVLVALGLGAAWLAASRGRVNCGHRKPEEGRAPLDAAVEIAAFLADPTQAQASLERLEKAASELDTAAAGMGSVLRVNVARRLRGIRALPAVDGRCFSFTSSEVDRTVIDYERFKLTRYLSSGVFPKRYFGFFDLKWDTAAEERRLEEVTHAAVKIINLEQERKGSVLRVSDIEVATTFLAEGGARLLTGGGILEQISPARDMGLDDLRVGLAAYGPLTALLQQRLGGNLTRRSSLISDGARARPVLSFREAILATALMYLYEKERAETELRNAGRPSMAERSLDEQFVVTSLMYNAGQLLTEERVRSILTFSTAADLVEISRVNTGRRPPLPVLDRAEALKRLKSGADYPEQRTSWSVIFHVLQRYGAFVAMRQFTDVFDTRGLFLAGRERKL